MRISEERLLHTLRATVLSEVRLDQPDLSMRQLAVALLVYQTDQPQTVRGLAAYLNISKPAVTRALDRLAEFDLTRRKVDTRDRRSIIVARTLAGDAMINRLKAALAEADLFSISLPTRER